MSESAGERPAKDHDELQSIYEDAAPWFDRAAPLDALTVGRYRERAFGDCSGRVLEVACGAGENLGAIPDSVELVGLDLSPDMLARARERAARTDRDVTFTRGTAESLPFRTDAFDDVCSALSTCTFPHPVTAVEEMARVCRPGGRVRLLEHGRSSLPVVAGLMDRYADRHFERMGCRLTQRPLSTVREAGLDVCSVDRYLGGTISVIVATP